MSEFTPINAAARTYAQAAGAIERPSAAEETTPAFAALLRAELEEAAQAGQAGEQTALRAVAGEASLQEVVEAVTAAEVGLQTVTALRDRAVQAYQEILRMPI